MAESHDPSPEPSSSHSAALSKWVAGISDEISKVQLKGGVVGKVARVLIYYVIGAAMMAWFFHDSAFALAGMGMVGLVVTLICWKLIDFADKHPEAALLEGAEFLTHEQMKLAQKQHHVITDPGETVEDSVIAVEASSDQGVLEVRDEPERPVT